MKEYKYKINGNVYKVTVGNVEGNIAEVEVNGTRYKVEMEKAPEPKPVVVPLQGRDGEGSGTEAGGCETRGAPGGHHPGAAGHTGVETGSRVGGQVGREVTAAGRHPGNQGERGRRSEEGPDGRHSGGHEDGEQHQRRPRRQSVGHQCQAGRLRA